MIKLFNGFLTLYANKNVGIGLAAGDIFKKTLEVQFIPVKINRYWFMVTVSWTKCMDHAGPSFSLELPFIAFYVSIYDTRHWYYSKNRWYEDGEEQYKQGEENENIYD